MKKLTESQNWTIFLIAVVGMGILIRFTVEWLVIFFKTNWITIFWVWIVYIIILYWIFIHGKHYARNRI